MTTNQAVTTITFENVENTLETMPVGTRVARRHPTQGDRLATVTGWSSDGSALAVEWDNGGSTVSPASFRTYALVIEAPAAMTTNRYTKGQAVTVDFTGLGHVVACEYVTAHAQGGHVVKVMGKNVRVSKVTA